MLKNEKLQSLMVEYTNFQTEKAKKEAEIIANEKYILDRAKEFATHKVNDTMEVDGDFYLIREVDVSLEDWCTPNVVRFWYKGQRRLLHKGKQNNQYSLRTETIHQLTETIKL